ncbi:peptidyl-prolyl cis-trans fkbp-type [Nannochloropsis gaditana]|uniref:Peptidyl-prolyl cis-trans fkbp-type n=1 Tax=Nannochloropsis gaditana TaxID=72520 RepID=W7TQZ5_9STRA|nr:peptidyl-prolyl cis-trans fkbp-type [Nannochloropsis gaditana]
MEPSLASGPHRRRRDGIVPHFFGCLVLFFTICASNVLCFRVKPCIARDTSRNVRRACRRPTPSRGGGEDVDRMDALKTAGMVATAGGLAIGGLPNLVEAKKIINLEEARELGEKKMIDIEKAKGPLIKVRDNVKYREELIGKGDIFKAGDLVKIRYQVYKGNGDYMFSTGYGREFQNDVGGRSPMECWVDMGHQGTWAPHTIPRA